MATTTSAPARAGLFPFELVRPELERVEIAICTATIVDTGITAPQ